MMLLQFNWQMQLVFIIVVSIWEYSKWAKTPNKREGRSTPLPFPLSPYFLQPWLKMTIKLWILAQPQTTSYPINCFSIYSSTIQNAKASTSLLSSLKSLKNMKDCRWSLSIIQWANTKKAIKRVSLTTFPWWPSKRYKNPLKFPN